MDYHKRKYIKYKKKYLELQGQRGGQNGDLSKTTEESLQDRMMAHFDRLSEDINQSDIRQYVTYAKENGMLDRTVEEILTSYSKHLKEKQRNVDKLLEHMKRGDRTRDTSRQSINSDSIGETWQQIVDTAKDLPEKIETGARSLPDKIQSIWPIRQTK